jgi:hypothetical protein
MRALPSNSRKEARLLDLFTLELPEANNIGLFFWYNMPHEQDRVFEGR